MAASSFPDHLRVGTAAGHPGGSWPCWDSPRSPRVPVSLCRAERGRGSITGWRPRTRREQWPCKMPGAQGALWDTGLPQPDAMSVFIKGSCLIILEQARTPCHLQDLSIHAGRRWAHVTRAEPGSQAGPQVLASPALPFSACLARREGPRPHARVRGGYSRPTSFAASGITPVSCLSSGWTQTRPRILSPALSQKGGLLAAPPAEG